MTDERRESCCDQLITNTNNIKAHRDDIKGLKSLYRPVYGLCIFFALGVALVLGLKSDTKAVAAAAITHERANNVRFREYDELTSELIGRYKVIKTMLGEIRADQKEILKWQREQNMGRDIKWEQK